MSTQGETLRHPLNGRPEETWQGFSWPAFFFSAIWLLVKGLWGHAIVAILLSVGTAGFASPLVWLFYGFSGNDLHRKSLLSKGYQTMTQYDNAQRPAAPVPVTVHPAPPTVLDQLAALGRLRDSGVLTESEFSSQKAKLLGA